MSNLVLSPPYQEKPVHPEEQEYRGIYTQTQDSDTQRYYLDGLHQPQG